MLPGTRRAINNQINEKYFLPRVNRREKGWVEGEEVSASSALTYNTRSLSCVRASEIGGEGV